MGSLARFWTFDQSRTRKIARRTPSGFSADSYRPVGIDLSICLFWMGAVSCGILRISRSYLFQVVFSGYWCARLGISYNKKFIFHSLHDPNSSVVRLFPIKRAYILKKDLSPATFMSCWWSFWFFYLLPLITKDSFISNFDNWNLRSGRWGRCNAGVEFLNVETELRNDKRGFTLEPLVRHRLILL